MNKKTNAALLASAMCFLYAHPSYGQCQGDQFSPGADADIPWHPVSIYVDNACKKIKVNWHPPSAEDAAPAIVSFIIDLKGKPTDIKLAKTSHVKSLDQLAIDSVAKCSDFGEVPKERKEPLPVELSFSTELPEYYYGPELDRGVKVVMLADKDELVSDTLAKSALDLEEKLVRLWIFDPKLVQKNNSFCALRVKISRDGTVEHCDLIAMPRDGCLDGPRNLKVEAAALALIRANKNLLARPADTKSRYFYLSFRARKHDDGKSLIAYKAESSPLKRFSDLANRKVLNHWRPLPGEKLDGTVRLEVTFDEKGNITELETGQRDGGADNMAAARRALLESLPLVPPFVDGSANHLYFDFEAHEDPSTWKVFHRYFGNDPEGYTTQYDAKKTDENVARHKKGVISSKQAK